MNLPPRVPGGPNPGDPKPSPKGRRRSRRGKRPGRLLILLIGSGGLTAIAVALINGWFGSGGIKAPGKEPKKEPPPITIEKSVIPGNIIVGNDNVITNFHFADPALEKALRTLETALRTLEAKDVEIKALQGNRESLKQAITDWVAAESKVQRQQASGEIDQKEASRLLEQARKHLVTVGRRNQKLFSEPDRIEVKDALATLEQAAQSDVLPAGDCEALYRGGQYEKAIACYSAVIRANPQGPQAAKAHELVGWAYFYMRNLEEALGHFAEWIELEPDNAEAYVARGRVYYERKDFGRGDIDSAINDFMAAVRRNPQLASGHHGLADSLGAKGDKQKDRGIIADAIGRYGMALRFEPDDTEGRAWSFTNRGWCHAVLGWIASTKGERGMGITDFKLALDDLRRATQMKVTRSIPGLALAFRHRIEINMHLHKETKAGRIEAGESRTSLNDIIADATTAVTVYPRESPLPEADVKWFLEAKAWAQGEKGDTKR